jgi:hypothetical protein
MWIWCSATGALLDAQRQNKAYGYAGRGSGVNNPDLQHVKGIGPLPEAVYVIAPPRDSDVTGAYSLPLIPQVGSELYGRSSFAVHGDSHSHPGEASHGCIVLTRAQREKIWASDDHVLRVVAI